MTPKPFDEATIAAFFNEQPQPAFWMTPVWDANQQQITDFEYSYCNREFYAYTGLTNEEVLGVRLFSSPAITEDEHRKKFFLQMQDVYLSGKRIQDQMYNKNLNRSYSFVRSRIADGVLTVLQDRTAEFSMLRQLEEQTAFTNSILKNSSNGIAVSEVIRDEEGTVIDGRIILANTAAEQYLQLSKEDYALKTIIEIDPHFISSPVFQRSIETLRTGTPLHTQYHFAPADKWLELSVSKLDENRLISTFTDISEEKATQMQLEQAAERLQAVFDASQSGMFTFAPVRDAGGEVVDFRFVITNPTFAAYVGQTPKGLQGALGSTFFPGYLHNGVFDMYKHTYLTGETQRRDVHYNVDGLDLYLDLRSAKVDDEVLVTFNDYTALKKAQLQLEKFVDVLKQSNANLEEFAHAASHDLKEPIRKIRLFADRLKTSLTQRMNETEAQLFERLQTATERMTLLVDDLLSYSHASLTPPQMENVDLNAKLRLVLTDLEIQVEEKKAVIEIGEMPTVKGYRRQLQQLFQNLISNALKYSRQDVPPRITIRSRRATAADIPANLPAAILDLPFYLIEVSDNGIGFEQQYAERIFGMFQRLHGKSEYSGTGVGLSIARKVAENHGGHIWAESEPGKGATFRLLLPIR